MEIIKINDLVAILGGSFFVREGSLKQRAVNPLTTDLGHS